MKSLKKYLLIFLILSSLFFLTVIYAQDNQADQRQKGSLVVFGDATLTYASYFFLLPPIWIPYIYEELIPLVHEKGFWRGRHRNGQAWILIATKIAGKKYPSGDFISEYKNSSVSDGRSFESYNFKPLFNYPYEVYLEHWPKKRRFQIMVFAKLPEHIINFNLGAWGEDASCLKPYLEDFNRVIATFRWILGLSDEEIAKAMKGL